MGSYPEPSGFVDLSSYIEKRSPARLLLIYPPTPPNLPGEPPRPPNMPAGYSSRCKTCNSSLRTEIERWHVDGMNDFAISKKLRDLGESISDKSLTNHFTEHYNVAKEAEQQYNESQANLEEAAGERVSEIVTLDNMIAGKAALHQKLEKILTNRLKGLEDIEKIRDLPKLPMAYVSLYTGCATGLCQTMKTKQELLGEDGAGRQAKALETWVDLMMEDDDTSEPRATKADP
jgi:hypothetical protein